MRLRVRQVAALAAMTAAAAAVASAATPQGDELVVSQATNFVQEDTVVTISSSGAFAVAWQTEPAAGAHDDIALRFFNADGTPATADLDVASGAPDQDDPQIAGNASGSGVVVYEHTDDPDGTGLGEIRARRFSPAGVLGPEFPVNVATPTITEEAPSVAMNGSGAFVAVWRKGTSGVGDGEEVRAQRFEAAGVKVGGEISVNTTTAGNQDHPSVGMDDTGGFVVAWDDSALDGSGAGIYARTFAADGTPVTGETLVNQTTALAQGDPDVARDPDGDSVVVWEGFGPGSVQSVWGRRLTPAGAPEGSESLLTPAPTGSDLDPAVALDASGRPTAVWSAEDHEDLSQGIMIRDFGPGLTDPSEATFVNTTRPLDQSGPDVAVGTENRVIVGWEGRGAASTSSDALARRASRAAPAPTVAPPTPVPPGATPPAPTPKAPASSKVTAASLIKLPSAKKCVSRRLFRIRLVIPKGFAVLAARVFVNSKRVKVVKGPRLRSAIDLRGLPKGRFTVKIEVTPKAGKTLRSSRRYRTCVPKTRAR